MIYSSPIPVLMHSYLQKSRSSDEDCKRSNSKTESLKKKNNCFYCHFVLIRSQDKLFFGTVHSLKVERLWGDFPFAIVDVDTHCILGSYSTLDFAIAVLDCLSAFFDSDDVYVMPTNEFVESHMGGAKK